MCERQVMLARNKKVRHAFLPGAVAGSGQLGFVYTKRNIDVQILNSLILFVLAGFAVKFAQTFLSIFSVNI